MMPSRGSLLFFRNIFCISIIEFDLGVFDQCLRYVVGLGLGTTIFYLQADFPLK